jgi:hypothetical protein
MVLGFELRASHLLGRCSTALPVDPCSSPVVVLDIFEIGSQVLLAWVGFEQ